MKFISNKLRIENVVVQNISKKYGTPAYCYSYNQLKENIDNFKKKFKSFSPLICFAIKSNTNINLIKEIKKFGLGADVVSMGELMIALKAGIAPKKIVFSGIGKTAKEIEYAINKKILLINAESISEIKEIERIAKIKKRQVEVGIRLNPNTDAKTLNQISTGKKGNKFGVSDKIFHELVKYCKSSKNIKLKCLSVHIGSQILDHQPYKKMLRVVDSKIYFTISVEPGIASSAAGPGTPAVFTSEVHSVPIGLTMAVTPQISENDQVTLNVRPTISRIIRYVNDPNPALAQENVINQIPEIQIREIESILKVESGQIAILGGLMQDTVENSNSGLPRLNRLPIIGNIFSQKDENLMKTELIIFIRPVVIKQPSIDGDFEDFRGYLPTDSNSNTGRNAQLTF